MAYETAIFAPPPGTVLGETDYSIPGQWCASDNVRFVDGKMQPIGGWQNLITTVGITANCVAALEWYSKDGTRRMALGGTDLLSVVYGTTLSSQATITLTPFTSLTSNRWSFDLWGDHLIACWSGHYVSEWSLNPATPAVAVTNAPTQNTIALVTETRQLMVLGTKEEASGTFNPRCIRWSTTEDNTVWTTLPSNLAGEYILDGAGGSIKAAKKLPGGYIAVWTDDELFLGRFTGDPNNPWVFERQAVGCGCAGTDAVTVADGTAYWISTDRRLMVWVPGSEPTGLPGVPLYYLNGLATVGAITNSYVWHNRTFNEVWFHIPTNNGYPESYLAVHVPSLGTGQPVWFPGSLKRSMMYQGINGVFGWDWVNLKLYTHETGKHGVGGVNSSLLTWSSSALVYLDNGQKRVEINRWLPDIESQSGNITLTISALKYPQGAETTLQTKTLAPGDDKSDFRASGKLFRFAFSGNDGIGATDTFCRLGKQAFQFAVCGDE